jgi:limonene 1,2-monooxygenase
MVYQPGRMTFGIFLAPFHRVGENPTLALERDMQLIEHLDALDFDEAWIGEHHSAARELIAEPMIFIAMAAARTKKIMLGTGVTSLPYHHPLMVADRLVQLDHMTRGRAMLGIGPGALLSDAYMMGIDATTQRQRMNESMDAVMALLRHEDPVNIETDWFTLRDARLQLANYTQPHLPVAVATTFTPSGPTAAGRHGVGLISVAGATDERFQRTWNWVEEAADEAGREVDRGEWRVVLSMHLADTKKEALADVADGFVKRAYVGDSEVPGGGLALGPTGATIEEAEKEGGLIIGTPDDAIAAIEEIQERSGGFGGILLNAHEWASTAETHKSYELLARYVAPHFQGQLEAIESNRGWFEGNLRSIFGKSPDASIKAFTDAGEEVPEELTKQLAEAKKRREERERVTLEAREAQAATTDGGEGSGD